MSRNETPKENRTESQIVKVTWDLEEGGSRGKKGRKERVQSRDVPQDFPEGQIRTRQGPGKCL